MNVDANKVAVGRPKVLNFSYGGAPVKGRNSLTFSHPLIRRLYIAVIKKYDAVDRPSEAPRNG